MISKSMSLLLMNHRHNVFQFVCRLGVVFLILYHASNKDVFEVVEKVTVKIINS